MPPGGRLSHTPKACGCPFLYLFPVPFPCKHSSFDCCSKHTWFVKFDCLRYKPVNTRRQGKNPKMVNPLSAAYGPHSVYASLSAAASRVPLATPARLGPRAQRNVWQLCRRAQWGRYQWRTQSHSTAVPACPVMEVRAAILVLLSRGRLAGVWPVVGAVYTRRGVSVLKRAACGCRLCVIAPVCRRQDA